MTVRLTPFLISQLLVEDCFFLDMKKIYKYYKDRLIEISGKNRSLYAKKVSAAYSYDIGKILEGDNAEVNAFVDFLWTGKRLTYDLISKNHIKRLLSNLGRPKIEADKRKKNGKQTDTETPTTATTTKADEKALIQSQVKSLKNIKRNIEDFERETGRYELFVGYPFVSGYIGKETAVKAPLLLFSVIIHVDDNDGGVQIELKQGEPIQLNKVLITAYARQYNINLDEIGLEFDDLKSAGLKSIDDVITYLKKAGIKITSQLRKNSGLTNFDNIVEPKLGDDLEIKNCSVIGRFPLANSIYNDYCVLEKKNLTTDAIAELLENKRPSKKVKRFDPSIYSISQLDYAQESAIAELNQSGNMVIYGPPGTGKSQTIVNVITDALVKNKRVLVVSQKKAALDVVFNRLGSLNKKAMHIVDPEKNKTAFFERVKTMHNDTLASKDADMQAHELKYADVSNTLGLEIDHLDTISRTLFAPTAFGPTLQEMYAESYIINKSSGEYAIYEKLLLNTRLMGYGYKELRSAIRSINEKKRAELYYKRLEMQKSNPFVDHVLSGIDVHTLNTAKTYLKGLLSKRLAPFDMGKANNMRQLLGFYLENDLMTQKDLKPIINYIAKLQSPRLNPREVSAQFWQTLEAVKAYVGEYYLLSRILDRKGFAMAVDNILNTNILNIKLILNALDQYVDIRDLNINLTTCTEAETAVLNFAYENSKTLAEFKHVVDCILPVRMYHEIVKAEDEYKTQLSNIMDFDNIKTRVVSLKDEQQKVVREMCADSFRNAYKEMYNASPDNNNFFYQISKPQGHWAIRKLVEHYSDLLFCLYPCWLLSPESVSQLLPLQAGLFDLILFDEASQIFIESTLPTIYRGKNIAVAGDNKQLRPTAHFVRRYMGNEEEEDLDINAQPALEVESLLDLATARYSSARLNYHYRSKFEELINFSNYVFYDGKLQVAPNLGKNLDSRPIERIKVDGKWIGRHNDAEARKVVELIKKVIKERKNNETIGIITFNAEQGNHIADLIDSECAADNAFREVIAKERNRKDKGEDVSLFIKNLENVQGDERDIIIFSIGYAKNEYGKVVSQFGPLNLEGGENRLNVAITRAKSKIYVVTSIEPEELNVENAKNAGPKIFRKYLEYARAVSSGNSREVGWILDGLKSNVTVTREREDQRVTRELKTALEKIGYTVEVDVGDSANKLTLAIYDKTLDAYLVGIECDYTAYASSPSVLERDVLRAKFMGSRGWQIIRVWSRDFLLQKNKVIAQIDKAAKKVRENIKAQRSNSKRKNKAVDNGAKNKR